VPDFEVKVASGATLVPWIDPASALAPSRLRPRPGFPERFYRATAGVAVMLHAIVDGVLTPLDTALGGRLFYGFVVESPAVCMHTSSMPGQSSIQNFIPLLVGHHTVRISRKDGGSVLLHFDAA
jgi:hypothetical protein